MALILRTTPVELSDPTLGRLLALRLNVGVMRNVEKSIRRPIEPDEFIAKFLAIVARLVPDDVPTEENAFKAGEALAEEAVRALSAEARDTLAANYMAEMEPIVSKRSAAGSMTQDPIGVTAKETATRNGGSPEQRLADRPAAKLRDRVLGDLDRFRQSAQEIANTFVMSAAEKELMNSIARTAAPFSEMAAIQDRLGDTVRKILDDPVQRHLREMSKLAPEITAAKHLAEEWSTTEKLLSQSLLEDVARTARFYEETLGKTFSAFRDPFGLGSNISRAIEAVAAQQNELERSFAAARQGWERVAADTHLSISGFRNAINDSVASILENHNRVLPVASMFEEMLEQQRRDLKAITGARSMVKQLADQMDLAARMAAPFSDLFEQSRSPLSETLSKMTASLRAASLMGPYDGGLLAQSLTAAIAQHADLARFAELRGHSFLVDALHELEGWIQPSSDDHPGLVESEEGSAELDGLLASILQIFADYFARAKSLFEQQALYNAMMFVLAAAALYLSYDQRDLARKSLDVSIEALDVAQKQSKSSNRDTATPIEQQTAEQAGSGVDRNASEERLATALERLELALSARHETPIREAVTRYVVERRVLLKAERRMKSDTVATLYPNQVVELISRDAHWIQVRYYDHLEGQVRSGWVVKKYLRMQKCH